MPKLRVNYPLSRALREAMFANTGVFPPEDYTAQIEIKDLTVAQRAQIAPLLDDDGILRLCHFVPVGEEPYYEAFGDFWDVEIGTAELLSETVAEMLAERDEAIRNGKAKRLDQITSQMNTLTAVYQEALRRGIRATGSEGLYIDDLAFADSMGVVTGDFRDLQTRYEATFPEEDDWEPIEVE